MRGEEDDRDAPSLGQPAYHHVVGKNEAAEGVPPHLDPRDPLVKLTPAPMRFWALTPPSRRMREVALVAVTLAVTPFSLVFTLIGLFGSGNDPYGRWAFALLGLMPLLPLGNAWRRTIARRLIGPTELTVDPPGPVSLGTTLRVVLDVAEGAETRIGAMSAVLIEQEWTHAPRRRRKWRKKEIGRRDLPIELHHEGEGARLVAELQVPRNTRPTEASDDHRHDWRVRVDVGLRFLPDARYDLRVVLVRPDGAQLPEGERYAKPALVQRGPKGTIGRCPRDGAGLGGITGTHARDCPSCRGLFVAADGLQAMVLDPLNIDPTTLKEMLASMSTPSRIGCSACAGAMVTVRLRSVPVDVCTLCGACWLDAGERDTLTSQRGTH